MKQALIGAQIFDGDEFKDNCAVIIEHGKILACVPLQQVPNDCSRCQLNGGVLAPGFIDIQVNGGGGVLFNNQTNTEGLATISKAHRGFGTTSFMPTLISDSASAQQRAISAVRQARQNKRSGVLGLHLEGPFLNPLQHGAHQQRWLRQPSQQDIDALCALSDLKLVVTLAPEQTQEGQIAQLSRAGIIVSAGHTDATAQQIENALKQGLKGFTHLFNAMSPLKSRAPGVVGAALADNNSWCGIIADGHHVDPTSIKVALQAKCEGKLFLVSDAMATIGSKQKSFELHQETIHENHGRLLNQQGKLAGSAIALIHAIVFCHRQLALPLEKCLAMASLYPAQFLQCDHYLGRIKADYQADLVHFDEQFKVCNTWVAGAQQTHQHQRADDENRNSR